MRYSAVPVDTASCERLGGGKAGPVEGTALGPEVLVSMQGPYALSAQSFPPELYPKVQTPRWMEGGRGDTLI